MVSRLTVLVLILLLICSGTGMAGASVVEHHALDDKRGTGSTLIDESAGKMNAAAATARGDWIPHHTITVHKNGTATVDVTIDGSGRPDVIRLLTSRGKNIEVVDGEEGLKQQGSYYNWNPADAEHVRFTVALGVQNRPVNTGTFDDGVLFALSETVPVSGWQGEQANTPAVHRFTVETPDGWDVAAPGRQVGENTYEVFPAINAGTFPRDMVIVGDLTVERRSLGTTELRVARLSSTEPAASTSEIADTLQQVGESLEEIYGSESTYGRLVVVTPADHEPGGLARDHSVIINERAPLYSVERSRSVYAHELAHTYQRFRGPNWHKEGQASYMQMYALYHAGIISESEFRRMLQIWITSPRGEIGDPIDGPVQANIYFKGAAVYAALDADIRARSDGEHDITDFVATVSDQRDTADRSWETRYDILREDEVAVLNELTGEEYEQFYARYVDGQETPSVLLDDDFTLAESGPIEHGQRSRAVLRAELEEQDERIEELEAANQGLRTELNESEQRNEELQQQLEDAETRNEELQQQLEEAEVRNEELREELNDTKERNQAPREQQNQSAAQTSDSDVPRSGFALGTAGIVGVIIGGGLVAWRLR